MNRFFLVIIGFVFLASCGNSRKLKYLNDIKNIQPETSAILEMAAPKIQVGDILSINVSSLNSESNLLFNSGTLQNVGVGPSNQQGNRDLNTLGYQVNSKGDVSFPVLGDIHLAGLTKEEAQHKMVELLKDYVREPIVNVRYLNFKITVIGEVNRPATLTLQNERVNILEALGLAGDMTLYGIRDSVLLIREEAGVRTVVRLNLQSSEILNSPYYYLKQNDIVYVEPNKIRDPSGDRTLRLVTAISSTASALALIVWRLFL